jgi:hypothetical protein
VDKSTYATAIGRVELIKNSAIKITCNPFVAESILILSIISLALLSIILFAWFVLKNKLLTLVLGISTIVKTYLALVTPYSTDFLGMLNWASVSYYHFWDLTVMGNFTPIPNLIYRLWLFLPIEHPSWPDIVLRWGQGNIALDASNLLLFMLKTPMIASDLLLGILLYLVVKHMKDSFKAKRALIIWLVFPYVTLIAEMFSPIDVIVTLLTMLSFYFFIKGYFLSSSVALVIGTFYKLYPMFLIIPFLMLTLKRKNVNLLLGYFIFTSSFFVIISLAVSHNVDTLKELTKGMSLPDTLTYLGTTIRWSYPVQTISVTISLLTFVVVYLYFKKYKSEDIYLLRTTLSVLLVYFAASPWFPQFLFLLMPFLIAQVACEGREDLSILVIVGITSIVFVIINFGFYFFSDIKFTAFIITKWWPQVHWLPGANSLLFVPVMGRPNLESLANFIYSFLNPNYSHLYFSTIEVLARSIFTGACGYEVWRILKSDDLGKDQILTNQNILHDSK